MSQAVSNLIERTDRALQGLEDKAIDRIYAALDASYRRLERDLLKAYQQQAENLTLLPNQRKLLILDQVKDLMSLVDTRSSQQLEQNFENLLRGADAQGRSIASQLSEAISNQKLESFADVPIEALKFQAEDGVKRLARHGEEFASRASAVVEMGLVQGWGARKVASQLRSELGVTKGRAEAIARTETLSAHNSAIEANFKANGIDLVQVFATSDERTCFPAGTLITTDKGDRPIEQIRVGDKVLTRQGFKRVNNAMCRDYAGNFTQVKAGNLSVISTADHPFWTHRGWIEAQAVNAGDLIQTFNQQRIQVDRINHLKLIEPQQRPAVLGEMSGLAIVLPLVAMPVSTVRLDCQTRTDKGKIDRVSAKPVFLNEVELQPLQRFSHSLFQRSFSNVLTVAGHTTKTPAIAHARTNSEHLFTGRTGDFERRAAAFLRTVMAVASCLKIASFAPKLLIAALAMLADAAIFEQSALATTNAVATLDRSANTVGLLADRTSLLDALPTGSVATPGAKLSRPTGVTLENLITDFTSNLDLSLFLPGNRCAGERAVNSSLPQKSGTGSKLLAAHGANRVGVLFGSSASLRDSLTLPGAVPGFFGSAGRDEKCFLTNFTILGNRHFNSSDVANTCNYSNTVKVYNLSVDELPEYFANGILVHNCSTCSHRNQQVYKLGEMKPPFHVRCRCTIAPIKREWLEAGLVDPAWSQKYREDGLQQLQAAGRSPNAGVSPFEKAAGLTTAPSPVWTPSGKLSRITSPPAAKRQAPLAPGITALEAEFKALEKEFDKLVDDDPVGAFRSPTAKRLFELEEQLQALKQQSEPTPAQAQPQENRHLPYLDRAREIVGKQALSAIDKAATPTAQIKKLQAELAPLDAEFDRLLDENPSGSFQWAAKERYAEIRSKLTEAQAKQDAKALAAMQKIRSNLLSGMDATAAKQLADKVKILKSANKQVPEGLLREMLAEFYQMTGGKGGESLRKIIKTDDRAYANENGDLNIGSNDSDRGYRVDLWHEMGHHLEFESGERRDAMLDWVKSRATGEAKPLKQINSAYDDNDLTYPDHFVDPYVGKFYDDDSTEVISMGLQHFIDAETMLDFYRRDPEHFLMTIGAIRDD